MNESTKVYDNDVLTTFYFDDVVFPWKSNLKELEEDLIALSPKDKRAIKGFTRTIKAYAHIKIPLAKPLERMNPFEFMVFGISMSQAALPFLRYKKMSVKQYAKRFKDKRIGQMMLRFMGEEYNMHSFFYTLQGFCTHDAGIFEGGSLKIATNVSKHFLSLGGKLHLSSPVKEIVFEDKTAKGIRLENGEFIEADYVVSSTDTYETFHSLAKDVDMPKFFADRYSQKEGYALLSAFQLSYATDIDLSSYPRMMDFEIEPIEVAKKRIHHFSIRNFSFDKTLSKNGKTLMTILIPTNEQTYDELASLSKEDYLALKKNLGESFLSLIAEKTGIQENHIECLDVVTPLTYTRYTNAYKGSYMSFVTTEREKGLMTSTIIKGYKNFLLGGQWLMPPGGLPIALMIGKHAAYNLCYLDKKKFLDLDKARNTKALKTN